MTIAIPPAIPGSPIAVTSSQKVHEAGVSVCVCVCVFVCVRACVCASVRVCICVYSVTVGRAKPAPEAMEVQYV